VDLHHLLFAGFYRRTESLNIPTSAFLAAFIRRAQIRGSQA
jgi:hypothetical protein